MQSQDFEVTGPVQLTVSPKTLAAIMSGLNELPHKFARPAWDEILEGVQSFYAQKRETTGDVA